MSYKKLIVGAWEYPLTFCRGLRINFMLHRYLILCFYGLTHSQNNGILWCFFFTSKTSQPGELQKYTVNCLLLFLSWPVYQSPEYITWLRLTAKHNTVRAPFLDDLRKTLNLLFQTSSHANEFTVPPMCWACRFFPPSLITTCLNFQKWNVRNGPIYS